eukprot:TRINITY_DN27069_c0_g1_i1.p1 TRINITY_DN27069_c0_g1~~TRINITY_DN27069_c0_g1_i1.p1  ORF type:complete len:524 (+),score=116.10 TRINITY_DN27069_c0_g1_i1:68-1573(+)
MVPPAVPPAAWDHALAKCADARGAPLVPRVATPEQAGVVLGPLIGRGAYGAVYRGTPTDGGATVAVKVIPRGDAGRSHRAVRRVLVELRIGRSLRSAHVPRLLHAARTDDCVLLTFELCRGEPLQSLLERQRGRPLRRRHAISIQRDLLSALRDCHAAQIVHRDVKPANIVVDSQTWAAKLVDFGLAKRCGRGDIDGDHPSQITPDWGSVPAADCSAGPCSPRTPSTPCGTPDYAALEVLRGCTERGRGGAAGWLASRSQLPKLDVWAAGAVAYVMLFGQLPWRAPRRGDPATQLGLLRREIESKGLQFPPTAPALPGGAVAAVRAMLDPSPRRRPTAAEALGAEWLRRDEGARPGEHSPSPGSPSPPAPASAASSAEWDVLLSAAAAGGGGDRFAAPPGVARRAGGRAPPAARTLAGAAEPARRSDGGLTSAAADRAVPQVAPAGRRVAVGSAAGERCAVPEHLAERAAALSRSGALQGAEAQRLLRALPALARSPLPCP